MRDEQIYLIPLNMEKGKSLLDLIIYAREQIYNPRTEGCIEEARETLKGISREIIHHITLKAPDFSIFYWLAQANYIMAESFMIVNDKENAKNYFESALKHGKRSIEKKGDVSDPHRIVGEIIGRLIPLKGWVFAMANAKRALGEIETSLQLDEKNELAYIALSCYHLFTPAIFGGSVDKAIESLRKALLISRTKHGEFLAHLWLGYSLLRRGDVKEAHCHLKRAVSIYPNNKTALSLLEQPNINERVQL